jgi:hypothetical protein
MSTLIGVHCGKTACQWEFDAMTTDLKPYYDALEAKRQDLFNLLYTLSADRLKFRIGPTGWSIEMHLEHVIIAEELIAADMEQTRSEAGRKFPAKTPEAFQMVIQVLEQDIPVEVPLPVLEPTGNVPLEELIIRWETARTRLKQLCDLTPAGGIKDPVCGHPVAGPP